MTSPGSGDASEAVETAAGPVDERPRSPLVSISLQVLRVLLAGCLLAQIAASLWLATLSGDLRTLVNDLRAGRVTVLEIGEAPDAHGLRLYLGDDPGTVIRWRVDGGGWRAMRADDAEFPTRDLLPPEQDPYGSAVPPDGETVAGMLSDAREDVAYAVAAAYAPHHRTVPVRATEDNPWQWGFDTGGSLAVLVMLLALLFGPQPRLATKWGWFWLYLIPAWLGLLAALVVEKPWSGRTAVRERRLDGWRGFATVLVVGLVCTPLVSIFRLG